jgi:ribosomal protein S27AE
MKDDLSEITAEGWVCGKCRIPLVRGLVNITYMKSSFPVELPRCPRCGFTFIPPELAMGKMLEVEKILEDK